MVNQDNQVKLTSYENAECILEDRLWVNIENNEGWVNLEFLQRGRTSNGELHVHTLFNIEGPSETLREGRHTYFPDDGYIFYMDYILMVAALDYCKKHFDMD